MAGGPRVPADRQVRELAGLYRDSTRRLEDLIASALERGAGGTAAYYQSQLAAVERALSALQDAAVPVATAAAAASYSQGLAAAERVLSGPRVAFSGVHQDAVNVLADNLVNRLNGAAATVGRRTEDAFRRAALQETAHGIIGGRARREVSQALERKLIRDGVTDALTGFVDAGGRRWALDHYAEMVARTTTREAVTQGTVNRMLERGSDVVTISSHANPCELCANYDGQTYSLSGQSAGLDVLDDFPPFHPNCRHVLTPGGANLDEFEQGLQEGEAIVGEGAAAPAAVAAPGFDPPPFSNAAVAESTAASAGRKASQDLVYALDPGPEAGAAAARTAAQDAEAATARKAARADERAASRAIDEELGPDLVAALDGFAKSGVRWARDADLKRALIDGETTLEEIEELAEQELAKREYGRDLRAERAQHRGLQQRSFPCFVCGRFKRRPADVCDHCGDDPVTAGGSAHDFNRAYGYESSGSKHEGIDTGGRGIQHR